MDRVDERTPRRLRARRLTALRVATVVVATGGAVAAVASSADPARGLTYFTLQSALLLACAIVAGARVGRRADRRGVAGFAALTEIVALVGSWVSALVYWSLIAPGEGPRWLLDEPLAALASLLQHAVLPPLALVGLLGALKVGQVRLAVRLRGRRARVLAVVALVWPVVWCAELLVLEKVGVAQQPYPFLDPGEIGGPGVVLVAGVVAAVTWGLGWILLALVREVGAVHPSIDGSVD